MNELDPALPETDQGHEPASERQMQALLADMWQHAQTLVRQEVALAKTELELRTNAAKAGIERAAIAGGLFHAAYLTSLATLVLVLAQWVAPWLAALIIAIAASAGAVVFALLGRQKLERAIERPHARRISPPAAHRAHS